MASILSEATTATPGIHIRQHYIRALHKMFRGVHFYTLCIGVSLSALILFAGIQYFHNTNNLSNKNEGNYRTLKKMAYPEDNLQNTPSNFHDDDSYIEAIMAKARAEIKLGLSTYNFSYSGVNNLDELVMESGGKPVQSLILSTWRSGSTFLGQILNAMPGDFFTYEPFQKGGYKQIRGLPLSKETKKEMKNIFSCNFYDLDGFFEQGEINLDQFPHNTIWKHCKHKKHLCYDADFTSKFCKLFPFQSIKTVGVRLRVIEALLDDEELNLKMILLVRDPRAVMKSRHELPYVHLDWTLPELLCADMTSDYVAATKILSKHPDKLMVLRFEELALNPYVVTHRLYKFLNRQPTESLNEFLRSHTRFEMVGSFNTYRVTHDVPFKWKNVLDFDYVNELQMLCKGTMDLWGYLPAHNATHMASEQFNPVGRVSAPIDSYYYANIDNE